jgi:hypothetical protein
LIEKSINCDYEKLVLLFVYTNLNDKNHMTIFGKLVLGTLMVLISGAVFYGLTSYVKEDSAAIPKEVATESTTTDLFPLPTSTSTDEGGLLGATTTIQGAATGTGEVSKPTGKKIPFTEFMSKGGSYTCSIVQTVANMTSNGTVYMHDALVRLEFSTSIANQTINTTMVARDNYMYTWTSTTPGKGYKTKISQSETSGKQPSTLTWNGSQVGDYTCVPWKADDSLFELPKSIVFTNQ